MADFRCRPGDLARVVHSTNPSLIGRIAIVERLRPDTRWNVTLLGDPVFGFARNGAPVITNNFAFRDSSLVPLRGEDPESAEQTREVSHGHA